MPAVSKQAKELKLLREKIDRYYSQKTGRPVKVKTAINLSKKDIAAFVPTTVKDASLWVDSVYYITHSIIARSERKKFKQGNKTKGFVSLKHKYLRDIIGPDTAKIIKAAINAKVIECDLKYSPGKQSLGYRLTDKYRKSHTRFVTLSNPDIIRRYKAVDQKLFLEQRKRLRDHAYLIKWYMQDKLKINKVEVFEYLRLYNKRMRRNFKNFGLSQKELAEVEIHLDNFLINCENVLENWEKPRVIIDGKGGRLYSPLTSIMSQLRYFTSYNSEELIYFDIKNSQPFHLIALLNPAFWDINSKPNQIKLRNLNKTLEEQIRKKVKKYSTTIMMLRTAFSSGLSTANKGLRRKIDTRPRFAKLVVDGKLYKFISKEFKGKFTKKSGFDPFADEKLAKYEMIRMLYFNPKEIHSPSKQYFQEFSKLFPVEANVIELLKSIRYQDFSILLQKIESTILLGNVCSQIFKQDSSIPFFTIHDGIMTTKKNAPLVEDIIRSTYKKLIGVEPELSCELMNKATAGKHFDNYITKKTIEIFRDLNKEFKEERVAMTVEDLKDLQQSGLFKTAHSAKSPVFVIAPLPWAE